MATRADKARCGWPGASGTHRLLPQQSPLQVLRKRRSRTLQPDPPCGGWQKRGPKNQRLHQVLILTLGERSLAVFGEETPLLLTDGEVSHGGKSKHVAFSCGKKELPCSDETDGTLQRHEPRELTEAAAEATASLTLHELTPPSQSCTHAGGGELFLTQLCATSSARIQSPSETPQNCGRTPRNTAAKFLDKERVNGVRCCRKRVLQHDPVEFTPGRQENDKLGSGCARSGRPPPPSRVAPSLGARPAAWAVPAP
ncbi:uncharacterized protein LOC116577045 [Mustela erminea]|uniref:uncharacterized protein LOC116577045 n=1 Tax=Mustela erminea TaxID=36723 RepID=UPI0013875B38|nr:uncharacterized protein LOC116577045 [Mustela erminea]